MKKIFQKILILVIGSQFLISTSSYAQIGTWTKVATTAPHANMGAMILLTNGTVMCHNTNGGTYGTGWDLLTPNASGSYASGTWTSIASMHNDRLFFSSQVLPSGKVYVAGGEYGAGGTGGGEVYDPVANTWTECGAIPAGWNIYDGNSEILYDGTVLEGPQIGANPSFDIEKWSPSTLNYTTIEQAPLNHDEAQWLKLPDSSVIFVGIGSQNSCRYLPKYGHWHTDNNTPINLYDTYAEESGCGTMLPNGTAIFFGANQSNAIYTPSGDTNSGTWSTAASFPTINGALVGQPDAAGAMMVNGHELLSVCPINTSASDEFRSPVYFVEYDYSTNTFTQVTSIIPVINADSIAGHSCYQMNMLDLPDGSVLVSIDQDGNTSKQYWEYTPGSAAIPQGKPTINSILPDGCPNYKITGKLFNGISEGASYGDDWQIETNYPIVRLTNGTNVYYAKTTNWNRIGAIQTDSLEDTCVFTPPASLPAGTYSLVVVVNGFASNPTIFKTLAITIASHTNSGGCTPNGSATANAATGGISPYTYSWSPSGGTNLIATSLSGGSYTITATDNNGCTATASVTITQPATTVTESIASHTNATCIGNNGSATANAATGGVSPYTYAWAPSGGTNLTASSLSAGTYTITATDHNGCIGTASVTITQPSISITITSSVNASCGSSNGSATANAATGGTSPYTYAWSPSGGTNLTASSLSAGTYTITATDHNGCTGTASVTILSTPTVIFSQNFEGTATIYTNGVTLTGGVPATTPASQVWGSANATDGNDVFHRDNTQGAWASNDNICGQPYQPTPTCAANGSTYSALFDNWDANSFTTGNIISPTINLGSAACGTAFSFYYYIGDCRAADSESTLALQFYNGIAYSTVWSDLVGCTGGWKKINVVVPSSYFVSNFKFQFIATAGNVTNDLYPVGVDEIVITGGCPLDITIASQTNIHCHGGATGSITANSPSGGTSPYTYSWTPSGGTNLSASSLSAGTYTITVTDNSGCTATASATITQPATGVGITASVTANIICNGSSTGSVSSSTSGGTSPYTYSWSGGGTNTTKTGLTAGTYTITVTDNTGCSASASATVTQPGPLSIASITITDIPCRGSNNGILTGNPSNGTTPYTYSWTGGGTAATYTGLSAGTYTLTLRDNCGASVTASASITQPAASLSTIANITANVPCLGGSSGSASSSPSGGTSPYSYSWSGGGTSQTKTGLSAGNYTVTVTDNHGCTSTASVSITQPATGVGITASVTANVSCNGKNNGSASSNPTGGTLPYTYSWSGGGANQTKTGLSAGTYTITVTDKDGCTSSASVSVSQPLAITIVNYSAPATPSTGACVGIAAVTVTSGGIAPFTYLWSPGGQTTDTIKAQCSGTYCCTITDNNGCVDSSCVTITTTGVANINNASGINIYPDPNTGSFTIAGVVQGQVVEIYNDLGQQISSTIADKTTMYFDISNKVNGIYLVRILNKDGGIVIQRKIVKTQ